MTEEWCRVPSFSRYEITRDGKLRRCVAVSPWHPAGVMLHPHNLQGYRAFDLIDDQGKKRKMALHRLLALTFLPPPPSPAHNEVAHWDGDKQNCALDNLRWATRGDNQRDRIRHGTGNTGSRNGTSKLNEAAVVEIRRRYVPGVVTQRELADEYGVSRRAVGMAISGAKWKHVTEATT